MSQSTDTISDAGPGPRARGKPRWSAVTACATAWLLPATVAARTAHISLKCAFLMHAIGGALAILLTGTAFASLRMTGEMRIARMIAESREIAGELATAYHRAPVEFVITAAGIMLFAEAAFVALALLLTPWGACDEPIRASFAHALRRVWLHTGHLIAIVFVFGAVLGMFNEQNKNWLNSHPMPTLPTYVGVPMQKLPDGDDKTATAEYRAAKDQRKHQQQIRADWYASRPWSLKYKEPLLLHLGFGLVLWFLWGIQRGVGVARCVEPVKRPPTCEFCGYNLTAMPMEGRCPECGRGVDESLGTTARPGTAFQRHRGAGRWRAWGRCCADVIGQPSTIGRELRLTQRGPGHRSYFLCYLPLFFGISLVGVFECSIADNGWESSLRRADEFLFAGAVLGYGGMIAAAALTLLGALVVGFTVGRDAGRNVLVASRRIATYLGGFLALWILYAWASGAAVIAMVGYDVFEPLERITTLTEGGVAFLLWSLPNIVLLMVYFAILGRGTTAARFANQ